MIENKLIISENNFKAKVAHLKGDLYIYHRINEDLFKKSNSLGYHAAIKFENKLYDTGLHLSITQYNDSYDFELAKTVTIKKLEANKAANDTFTIIDNFVYDHLFKMIDNDQWILVWLLDVIKSYSLEHYERAIEVRETIKKENELRYQRVDQEREAREREYQERQEERRKQEQAFKDKVNFCNGFLDNKNPMQKQRLANILNKQYRYNGIVLSRKDAVLTRLREGRIPKQQRFYGDSKVTYMLSKENNFLEITKTEYDYSNYLLELGLENAKLSSEMI